MRDPSYCTYCASMWTRDGEEYCDDCKERIRRDIREKQIALDGEWLCACGLPMSRNPHPDAGDPSVAGLEIGAHWECIPCTVKSRHRWAKRARKAEIELERLKEVNDA